MLSQISISLHINHSFVNLNSTNTWMDIDTYTQLVALFSFTRCDDSYYVPRQPELQQKIKEINNWEQEEGPCLSETVFTNTKRSLTRLNL